MNKYKRETLWGMTLTLFSFLIYFIHYMFFSDIKYIGEDLIAQLAYLPIYIFLTTIVIDRLLNRREKFERLRRLNTIIGVFFSEMGKDLIKHFIKFDVNFHKIKDQFSLDTQWTEKKCIQAKELLKNHICKIDSTLEDIAELGIFLNGKRKFLTELMGNPNLMENEEFTELLIAVFHVAEELQSRDDIQDLPEEDYKHLSNDIERAYLRLINQWIAYMGHLKKEYPFLYSFAMRTNPFIGELSSSADLV
jgi:hypothetical protein